MLLKGMGGSDLKPASAQAEAVNLTAELVGDIKEEIADWRFLGRLDVSVPFEQSCSSSCEQCRNVEAKVQVAFAHGTAVQDHRVIEQRAVAVGRSLHPFQELPEQADLPRVELDQIGNLLRVLRMVRHGVMGLGDVEIGVDGLTRVAIHH